MKACRWHRNYPSSTGNNTILHIQTNGRMFPQVEVLEWHFIISIINIKKGTFIAFKALLNRYFTVTNNDMLYQIFVKQLWRFIMFITVFIKHVWSIKELQLYNTPFSDKWFIKHFTVCKQWIIIIIKFNYISILKNIWLRCFHSLRLIVAFQTSSPDLWRAKTKTKIIKVCSSVCLQSFSTRSVYSYLITVHAVFIMHFVYLSSVLYLYAFPLLDIFSLRSANCFYRLWIFIHVTIRCGEQQGALYDLCLSRSNPKERRGWCQALVFGSCLWVVNQSAEHCYELNIWKCV